MAGTERVAVDTGGTFTDFIRLLNDGNIVAFKAPSLPDSPELAIRRGFQAEGIPFSHALLHGTTVGTNALLEKRLPRVALLTTRGYRDVVAIGRQTRKRLYDLAPESKPLLVPDELIFDLDERTLADGSLARAVRQEELQVIWEKMQLLGAECLAICFLHAYKNPANERQAKEFFSGRGFAAVCTSAEVVAEYREYERFATTLINALLLPVMARYLGRLETDFSPERIHIMQSNGGIIGNSEARQLPVKTILSGPAGGVVACANLGRLLGYQQIIGFDMGGTSTDVSLIDHGIHVTAAYEVGDYPVKVAAIDIHTIGAGGGSIARFDAGGILRVGPESVGADPGPVFYGKGDDICVSDANLLARRLGTDFFHVGTIQCQRSERRLAELARRHHLKSEELILGILRVVNSNMERAIKKVSSERGHDLRDFILLSFGGAGGLHSPYLARELGMKAVLVPRYAGVFSALGILSSDIMADFSQSVLLREADEETLAELFAALLRRHREDFLRSNRIEGSVQVWRFLDVRYLGQSYEILVPHSRQWRQHFSRQHKALYGTDFPDRDLEVVNIRLRLVSKNRGFRLPAQLLGRGKPQVVRRELVLWDEGFRESPIYYHQQLPPGSMLKGPAVVLSDTATAIVPPRFRARVDGYLNLLITHA